MDNKQKLLETWQQLIAIYTEVADWQLRFDRARQRAGACFPHRRYIQISEHHIIHNHWEKVLDTLLHELAHALVWVHYGEKGHGARWRAMAQKLGATPRATGVFKTPPRPWVMVWFDCERQQLIKVAERYRRSRHIHRYALRDRPETLGYIFYLSAQHYSMWQQGQMTLADLKHHIPDVGV